MGSRGPERAWGGCDGGPIVSQGPEGVGQWIGTDGHGGPEWGDRTMSSMALGGPSGVATT
jgi:hypothetical protein